MKKHTITNIGQEHQDAIFKTLSADKKVKLGSDLWLMAKDLVGEKIHYGKNRPASTFSRHRSRA